MIIPLRPHQIFQLIKTQNGAERLVQLSLPTQRTPIVLESMVLVALVKFFQPRVYFEIGTYLGYEILNIAANTPDTTKLFTLDFDKTSFQKASQIPHDRELTLRHFSHENQLAFKNSHYERKITQLFGDSTQFDFTPFLSKVDFIYVDGGHDYHTIKSDTDNALKMLPEKKQACIVWHDFGNPPLPDVKRFLEEFAQTHTLYHVEKTFLCFYLHQPSDDWIQMIHT